MKTRICLILCLTSMLMGKTALAQNPSPYNLVPPYAHQAHPHCGCHCENKIIYQHEKVSYENLLRFAQEAAIASYHYGFGNYKTALEQASQYYTPTGWEQFSQALNHSGNLHIVLRDQFIVSAIPSGEAKLIKQIQENQQMGWIVEIPLLVKYHNSEKTIREPLKITLKIMQTEENAGIQGIGIKQIIAKHSNNAYS